MNQDKELLTEPQAAEFLKMGKSLILPTANRCQKATAMTVTATLPTACFNSSRPQRRRWPIRSNKKQESKLFYE